MNINLFEILGPILVLFSENNFLVVELQKDMFERMFQNSLFSKQSIFGVPVSSSSNMKQPKQHFSSNPSVKKRKWKLFSVKVPLSIQFLFFSFFFSFLKVNGRLNSHFLFFSCVFSRTKQIFRERERESFQ
jgi:hypothetical protein